MTTPANPAAPTVPPSGQRSRARLIARLAPLLAVPLLLTACNFGASGGTDVQGQDIAKLYQLMFWTSIPVFVIVEGLIVWSAIKYRKKSDRPVKQFQYHLPVEVLYTVIPVLLVGFLFWESFQTETKVDTVATDPPMIVNVTAFQWQWAFQYPAEHVSIYGTISHYPTLVLPTGRTIEIVLRSADVIHSFWVPDFLFKRQAIPGVTNRFDIKIPKPGVFRGQCAQFCGLDHALMIFYVKAVPPAQFTQTLNREAQAQQAATGGATT